LSLAVFKLYHGVDKFTKVDI